MGLRQVVLDTETTGLDPKQGHRVIEIGAIELENRRLTGNNFHQYLNPERDVDPEAEKVHGLSRARLANEPLFAEIGASLWAYLQGACLIIHNAPFDLGFLNAEFSRLGYTTPLEQHCGQVIDTLLEARRLRPGKRNSLDVLCQEYGVDNSNRTFHGALLDCELLAEVYLAMTRGQESLLAEEGGHATETLELQAPTLEQIHHLRVLTASTEEEAAHARVLESISQQSKHGCVWVS